VSPPDLRFRARSRTERPWVAAGVCALIVGCAGAKPLPDTRVEELQQQVAAQANLLARQQQRIEELEVRVGTLASRASPVAGPAHGQQPAPAPGSSVPKTLQTIKLPAPPGGRRPHPPRLNPVERAPRLPAQISLREPDEGALAELEAPLPSAVDAAIASAAGADRAFAQAVQRLNDGEHPEAQALLLAFAARWPRHTAADNALYLAGLSRAATGDCPGAVAVFDRVPAEYPATDQLAPVLLEKGRCETRMKRPEAQETLNRLTAEFPDSTEAAQARLLLALISAGR
jgi:TolA-binding protein